MTWLNEIIKSQILIQKYMHCVFKSEALHCALTCDQLIILVFAASQNGLGATELVNKSKAVVVLRQIKIKTNISTVILPL